MGEEHKAEIETYMLVILALLREKGDITKVLESLKPYGINLYIKNNTGDAGISIDDIFVVRK